MRTSLCKTKGSATLRCQTDRWLTGCFTVLQTLVGHQRQTTVRYFIHCGCSLKSWSGQISALMQSFIYLGPFTRFWQFLVNQKWLKHHFWCLGLIQARSNIAIRVAGLSLLLAFFQFWSYLHLFSRYLRNSFKLENLSSPIFLGVWEFRIPNNFAQSETQKHTLLYPITAPFAAS